MSWLLLLPRSARFVLDLLLLLLLLGRRGPDVVSAPLLVLLLLLVLVLLGSGGLDVVTPHHGPQHSAILNILRGVALTPLGVVVQGHANGAAVVTIVLPDDLLTMKFPQACIVVTTGRDEVRAVGAKGTVPHPPLVARQGSFQWERLRLRIGPDGVHVLDLPYLGGVVGAAGRQLLHVGREQDARNVLFVR